MSEVDCSEDAESAAILAGATLTLITQEVVIFHRVHDKPRSRPWKFSLRSLFVITLAVAAFCGGWVSKERWDKPPAAAPTMNATPAKQVLKALGAERAELSRTIQQMQSGISTSNADELEMRILQNELNRKMATQAVLGRQMAEIKASLPTTGIISVPRWVIMNGLSISTLVIAFIAGINVGRRMVIRRVQNSE